jgi:ribonuclease HI
MEIRAALEALRALPGEGPLVVRTDSKYVEQCFNARWYVNWRKRGWTNAQKKPVANRDLWEPLIDCYERRGNVSFEWVRGHSGDPMNELVDRLAVTAALGPFEPVVAPGSVPPPGQRPLF